MPFYVLAQNNRPRLDWFSKGWTVYLAKDDWNDWYEFVNVFHVFVFDIDGTLHSLGTTKIGQFNQVGKEPEVPPQFEALDESFFSLGQDANYYETLVQLSEERRAELIHGLRDVAADLELFEKAKKDRVTPRSLLRFVTEDTVRKRFSRILRGEAQLTDFAFAFDLPTGVKGATSSLELDFRVQPESMPPTNVHVLIGRNGVGKTTCLRRISRSLVLGEDKPGEGRVRSLEGDQELFANLVSVTFSAFDPFPPLVPSGNSEHAIKYAYVGLQRVASNEDEQEPPKGPVELTKEFVDSARACLVGERRHRWRKALETLESDPLFEAADVTGLTSGPDDDSWAKRADNLFWLLSTGHKIVLLTVTRLVETVDERTLVLVDEPEAHLHPPLLSAFIRCLSDLLVSRNGVAIAATHSPVVLQEVPSSCVWILNRNGAFADVMRPEIETFGENVGVLTREVFGLEVTRSGFHQLLKEAKRKTDGTYDEIAQRFSHQLGSEAQAIALGLAAQDAEGE